MGFLINQKVNIMSDPQAPCAAREANHIMLDNAICNMDSVISHAEELFNRINSNNNSADLKNGCEKTEPTLSSVLNSAPQTINDKNTEMHDLLNKISELLF